MEDKERTEAGMRVILINVLLLLGCIGIDACGSQKSNNARGKVAWKCWLDIICNIMKFHNFHITLDGYEVKSLIKCPM